jgi:hypothetical protein
LDLLLGCLGAGGVPSLAHMLLGFDTTAPPADWHERALLPRSEFSCLTVLLDILQARSAAGRGASAGQAVRRARQAVRARASTSGP